MATIGIVNKFGSIGPDGPNGRGLIIRRLVGTALGELILLAVACILKGLNYGQMSTEFFESMLLFTNKRSVTPPLRTCKNGTGALGLVERVVLLERTLLAASGYISCVGVVSSGDPVDKDDRKRP